MLRVTIELVPHGDESRKSTLATAIIANDGTGDATTGNYDARFYDKSGTKLWKGAKVTGFPRRRRLPWDLLQRALNIAIGEERQ